MDLEELKNKLKSYKREDIVFTKPNLEILLSDRKLDRNELIEEILSLKNLKYIETEERIHKGINELRYRLYFVYSRSRGRFYVVRFNSKLKIITVFRLGRKTLNRYKRRLNRSK